MEKALVSLLALASALTLESLPTVVREILAKALQ